MKGPQLAALIWLTNLGLLGGGGFLGYHVYSTAKAEQDDTYQRVQAPKPKEQRVSWLATGAQAASAGHQDLLLDKLSPRVRPKKVESGPVVKVPDPLPVKEPTDDELKAELQKWVNEKFSLLRILSGPPSLASAVAVAKDAGNASVRLTTNMHFPTVYAKAKDANLKKLAGMDITVLEIQPDKVLIKGAAVNPKYKSKYFEVEMLINAALLKRPSSDSVGRPGGTGPKVLETPPGPMPDPTAEVEDPRPRESVYDSETDCWTLGTDDYKNINTDELAKYAKVVHDKDGKPLGIQISEEAPDDNVVLARGGRRGDIIKAINGQPVTSMADVRRIVRTQYNEGKEEFTVDYERDGQPGRKIFRAPRKKTADKPAEPNK
ncbi:MAG: hypothetical protein IT463_05435 [Planctomycetes bacterium]|nr:hypothetical protein [Planctomycetota bacterium]